MSKTKIKRLIPLTFDLAFKKMFGDEEHKERTAILISTFLDIPYEEIVDSIELINTEKRLTNKKDKTGATDIVAKIKVVFSTNERINLEMNMQFNQTKVDRNIGYISQLFGNQLKGKEDYKNLEKCIQINFNDIFVDKENKVIFDRYSLKNEYNNELTQKLEIYHINIAECSRIWYNNDIEKYPKKLQKEIIFGALLMEKDYERFKEVLEEVSMNDSLKENILDTTEEFSEDEDFAYLWYDKEQNDRAILNGTIAEERENERKKIARTMIDKNMDINLISELTSLSIEELKKL